MVLSLRRPRRKSVAICFFGIPRALEHTIASINANVIAPARDQADVRIYTHLFLQHSIENQRSGEFGPLDIDAHRLLPSDWLELEEPETCLAEWDFEGLKAYGDSWEDDFRSLRNLVHQLHSLRRTALAALADGAEVCLFCRPDLRYHDSLAGPIARALRTDAPLVQLPWWQPWSGLNDRFAICSDPPAIAAYGRRVEQMQAFCRETGEPMFSERLVKYVVDKARDDVGLHRIPARASRVRIDGNEREEDLLHPTLSVLRRRLLHRTRVIKRHYRRVMAKETPP